MYAEIIKELLKIEKFDRFAVNNQIVKLSNESNKFNP